MLNRTESQTEPLNDDNDVEAVLQAAEKYMSFWNRVSSDLSFWNYTRAQDDPLFIDFTTKLATLNQEQLIALPELLDKRCQYRTNFYGTIAWILGSEGALTGGGVAINNSDSLSDHARTGLLLTVIALAMLSLANGVVNMQSYDRRRQHILGAIREANRTFVRTNSNTV